MKINLMLLLAVISLVGCGTTQTYDGPKKSYNEVSKFEAFNYKTYSFPPKEEVYLFTKSGDKEIGNFYKGYPRVIDVLPGQNDITIEYKTNLDDSFGETLGKSGLIGGIISDSLENKKYIHINFSTEAGHSYIVMFYPRLISNSNDIPQPWVVDKTTNKVVFGEVPKEVKDPLNITKRFASH